MSKLAQLKSQDEKLKKVAAWLDHIGETDKVHRLEVRDNCMADPECLAYFAGRFDTRGEHDRAAA